MNAINGAIVSAKNKNANPVMAQWLVDFIDLYQQLDHSQLHRLDEVYSQDIIFEDPLHYVEGLTALTGYFEHMYANVLGCNFKITNHFSAADNPQQAALYWTMQLRHKKLNGGQSITVKGHSQLVARQGKIIYHRDYFDLGNMLYEQLPFLGALIRKVKQQAAKV